MIHKLNILEEKCWKKNSPALYKIYVSFLKFLPSKQTQYQNQIQIDWIPVSQASRHHFWWILRTSYFGQIIYLIYFSNLFICEPLILHYSSLFLPNHLLSLPNNVLIHRQHVSSEYKVRGGNGNVLITLETGVERDIRNYYKITHHTSHPRPQIHTLRPPTNLHNIITYIWLYDSIFNLQGGKMVLIVADDVSVRSWRWSRVKHI